MKNNVECPYNKSVQAISVPSRMARRPVDSRGYPVPFFVEWIDGVPDFRVVDPAKMVICIRKNLCWCCGEPMGRNMAFVIGPMCAVNRVSAEPPMHLECAVFAAMACPFLSTPKARRNEKDLPGGHEDAAGVMIKRNPGVSMVWVTRTYQTRRVDNGILFYVGDPENIGFYKESRKATLDEVLESLDSGKHFLHNAAKEDGHQAVLNFNILFNETRQSIINLYGDQEND